MFGQHPGELYRLRTEPSAPEASLHNVAPPPPQSPPTASLTSHEDQVTTAAATTAVPSSAITSTSASTSEAEPTWGERDVGGPVRHRMAMDDYEAMRRELTQLSQTQSKTSNKGGRSGLLRTRTSQSKDSKWSRSRQRRPSSESTRTVDLEAGDAVGMAKKEDEFELGGFIKEGHFEKRSEGGDSSAKKVGVVFKNLTVKGMGSTVATARTLPDAVLGTFGPDLYRVISGFVPALQRRNAGETRTLINDFTGVVRDGEMMLVLGRPGSGCTSFLKAVANKRSEYAAVDGEVAYGGISAEEQKRHFLGEVNYNPEDDQHFPSLNVWQTLKFSLMNKTRKRHQPEINIIIQALLKMFGISHTSKTLVGNEYVRGISGGERKRVSIAETLATKSTVVCWDNSTRGLDSSTALDYANSLRIMTDVSDRTTLVTLYQAGEDIFKLMDKVLVIDEGRMMYQGAADEAKQYFIDLGFDSPDRQTTADFLTSVTDPTQRHYRSGFEFSAPKTPIEFERVFRNSEAYKRVLADVADYERYLDDTDHKDAQQFKQSVHEQKSKTVSRKSNFTVSLWRQVLACTAREFWLVFGDRPTLYTKLFTIISNGLIVGSLFYDLPETTDGTFTRGGALFFSIVFLGWLQLTELMKAVSGRVVIARHKDYAFYRPSAVVLARVLADFPIILVQVIIFGVLMYFMTNLDVDVSKFFIYELFVYIITICITALYRMFAGLSPSIDDAVRFAGTALNLLIIYTGYVIAKPPLLNNTIWFGWLYHVNPIAYAFEGVLTSEFAGRVMDCAPSQLIPQGPGIQGEYQGCAQSGAELGSPTVTGEGSRSNLWRNFGVVIAFTVLYILVTALGAELFQFVKGGGGAIVFKKGATRPVNVAANVASAAQDPEKGGESGDSSASSGQLATEKVEESVPQTARSEEIFTWTDVEYSVPYEGSQRKLLNNVHGYAKPGVMIALMGASGAGKTTLLNTLSQRQTMGLVSGTMLLDGRPLGKEFQRTTGFVEQQDVHDGTSSIREAFEFSAILRQERDVSKGDKLAYVQEIIDLLELGEIQDALISSLGVEQRKRVTIGVELAAKPSLLFLDEPTSGLDSQSAYSIIRFLRKLAHAGHGLICTIHQPSSLLIQQFDMILALNPGGNTFYFGPVGENGAAVNSYFSSRGVTCPPQKNIAEFILETAIKGGKREDGKRLDWNAEWKSSQENKTLLAEISRTNSERSKAAPASGNQTTAQYEFASPVRLQTSMLTRRMFTQHWRDPSYYYGKLFVAVIIGIFNGFTFYALPPTVTGLQERMFTSFLIILIPPTVVNAVVPKFYGNLSLWLARERPSRIYDWLAFCTASIVAEIPISLLSAVIYWLLWYYPTGLPRDSSTAGYVFLMTALFFLFQASWGQWICAFAPSFTVISNVLPFFFVIFSLFNGVVRPYAQLSVFWKYWLYYLNPSTHWIAGVMAATLPTIDVRCDPSEAAYFSPPPGTTCAAYASNFVQRTARRGYLINPDALAACGYCPYATGREYMATLNVVEADKWPSFGVFAAFCVSNWALVYFFIWAVRVRGWSFGLGRLFGGLERGVEGAKRVLLRGFRRRV
ncbi:MAG: hypothetical protein L6R35_003666 [Caloplaca aegaea]|nr:MAG: hypothetical protein L6R35_003666 [Caloplaca aegaea]